MQTRISFLGVPGLLMVAAAIFITTLGCSAADPALSDEVSDSESVSQQKSALAWASDPNGSYTFSEERPGGITCLSPDPNAYASIVTGIACDGDHCDDVTIWCEQVPEKAVSSYWTPLFSEEKRDITRCGTGEFVTGVICEDSYCNNMALQCTRIANFDYTFTSSQSSPSGVAKSGGLFGEMTDFGGTKRAPYAFLTGLKCYGGWCDNLATYGRIPARYGSFAQSDWDPSGIGDWLGGKLKGTCPRSMAQIGLSIDQTAGHRASKALCSARSDVPYVGDVRETKFITGANSIADCGAGQFIAGSAQNLDGTFAAVRCVSSPRTPSACHDVSFESGDGRPVAPLSDWDPGHFKGECGVDEFMVAVGVNATRNASWIRCCRL